MADSPQGTRDAGQPGSVARLENPRSLRLLRHCVRPGQSATQSTVPACAGPEASGAWNMAVDEVLLESLEPGGMCLRFYDWAPATLSLGYFQGIGERDQHEASRDCPVVRRASGGGAILHDRELTYSIIVPRSSQAELDHRWLYDRMHESLLRTLHACSVPVRSCVGGPPSCDANPASGRESDSFLCFQRHCSGDLLLDSHKVVGSAQRRSQTAVLQHGSILLQRSEFAPELPGIAELAGVTLDPTQLVDRWLDVLTEEMGWDICEGRLSAQEEAAAVEKMRAKFASPDWTCRR